MRHLISLAFISLFFSFFFTNLAIAEKICDGKRDKMICDLDPQIKKREELRLSISGWIKKIFKSSFDIEKKVAQQIDSKLERFKSLDKALCNKWNACMSEEWMRELQLQYTEFLKNSNDKITPSRGTNEEKLNTILKEATELEKFYNLEVPSS